MITTYLTIKSLGGLYGRLMEEGNVHCRVLVGRKTITDPQHNPHAMILTTRNKGVDSLQGMMMRKMMSLCQHPDLLTSAQLQGVAAQDKCTERELINSQKPLPMSMYYPDHRLQNQQRTGDQLANTNTLHHPDNRRRTLKNHQKKQIIMMMKMSCQNKITEIDSHSRTEVPKWQQDPPSNQLTHFLLRHLQK
jgi:hypothetical protein